MDRRADKIKLSSQQTGSSAHKTSEPKTEANGEKLSLKPGVDVRSLSTYQIIALSRTIGNHALQRLINDAQTSSVTPIQPQIQRKIGDSRSPYETDPDLVFGYGAAEKIDKAMGVEKPSSAYPNPRGEHPNYTRVYDEQQEKIWEELLAKAKSVDQVIASAKERITGVWNWWWGTEADEKFGDGAAEEIEEELHWKLQESISKDPNHPDNKRKGNSKYGAWSADDFAEVVYWARTVPQVIQILKNFTPKEFDKMVQTAEKQRMDRGSIDELLERHVKAPAEPESEPEDDEYDEDDESYISYHRPRNESISEVGKIHGTDLPDTTEGRAEMAKQLGIPEWPIKLHGGKVL